MTGVAPLLWLQTDKRLPLPALQEVLTRAAAARYEATRQRDDAAVVAYGLLSNLIPQAQVFEFGRVPEEAFKLEAKRGGDLMDRGLLDLPYPTCVFWATYLFEPDSPLRGMVSEGDGGARYCTVVHRLESHRYLVLDALRLPAEAAAAMTDRTLPHGTDVFSIVAFGLIEPTSDGRWAGVEIETMELYKAREAPERLASLADGIAGMSMILATRNLPVRVDVPAPKLQAKRARTGKWPLPTVTYVDVQRWLEARNRSHHGTGTHSSPVPHLRRGHIRTYTDGRQVWIRDALVNAKSHAEAIKRDHYEIDTPQETASE